jgi:excisionase family DNA binding protein
MAYTLKQAAEATGRSKPTILRAIQSGKISGIKDEHGEWRIEPAELHRVYPPAPDDAVRNDAHNGTDGVDATTDDPEALRRGIAVAQERLRVLETERDRERRHLQDTIDDLRRRLDDEAGERRRLTILLTDQRAQERPRSSWLARLLGRDRDD